MDLRRLTCLALVTAGLHAQDTAARHNLEIGAAGVIPLSGYIADSYSAGPAWHPGYELCLLRPLGAEVGFTEARLPSRTCGKFGCEYPREPLRLLDWGLRGHIGASGGRIDLSAGLGGGYVWHHYGGYYTNGWLIQYSGKAAIALDAGKRIRLAFTMRIWRDPGRPTQQWMSTSAGVAFGLCGRL